MEAPIVRYLRPEPTDPPAYQGEADRSDKHDCDDEVMGVVAPSLPKGFTKQPACAAKESAWSPTHAAVVGPSRSPVAGAAQHTPRRGLGYALLKVKKGTREPAKEPAAVSANLLRPRRPPQVEEAVQSWWDWLPLHQSGNSPDMNGRRHTGGLATAGKVLIKTVYCALFSLLQLVLLRRVGLPPDAAATDYDPTDDWLSDCQGQPAMGLPQFSDALLRLAEVWGDTLNADAHATLLQSLLQDAQQLQLTDGTLDAQLQRWSHMASPAAKAPRPVEAAVPMLRISSKLGASAGVASPKASTVAAGASNSLRDMVRSLSGARDMQTAGLSRTPSIPIKERPSTSPAASPRARGPKEGSQSRMSAFASSTSSRLSEASRTKQPRSRPLIAAPGRGAISVFLAGATAGTAPTLVQPQQHVVEPAPPPLERPAYSTASSTSTTSATGVTPDASTASTTHASSFTPDASSARPATTTPLGSSQPWKAAPQTHTTAKSSTFGATLGGKRTPPPLAPRSGSSGSSKPQIRLATRPLLVGSSQVLSALAAGVAMARPSTATSRVDLFSSTIEAFGGGRALPSSAQSPRRPHSSPRRVLAPSPTSTGAAGQHWGSGSTMPSALTPPGREGGSSAAVRQMMVPTTTATPAREALPAPARSSDMLPDYITRPTTRGAVTYIQMELDRPMVLRHPAATAATAADDSHTPTSPAVATPTRSPQPSSLWTSSSHASRPHSLHRSPPVPDHAARPSDETPTGQHATASGGTGTSSGGGGGSRRSFAAVHGASAACRLSKVHDVAHPVSGSHVELDPSFTTFNIPTTITTSLARSATSSPTFDHARRSSSPAPLPLLPAVLHISLPDACSRALVCVSPLASPQVQHWDTDKHTTRANGSHDDDSHSAAMRQQAHHRLEAALSDEGGDKLSSTGDVDNGDVAPAPRPSMLSFQQTSQDVLEAAEEPHPGGSFLTQQACTARPSDDGSPPVTPQSPSSREARRSASSVVAPASAAPCPRFFSASHDRSSTPTVGAVPLIHALAPIVRPASPQRTAHVIHHVQARFAGLSATAAGTAVHQSWSCPASPAAGGGHLVACLGGAAGGDDAGGARSDGPHVPGCQTGAVAAPARASSVSTDSERPAIAGSAARPPPRIGSAARACRSPQASASSPSRPSSHWPLSPSSASSAASSHHRGGPNGGGYGKGGSPTWRNVGDRPATAVLAAGGDSGSASGHQLRFSMDSGWASQTTPWCMPLAAGASPRL